MQRQGINPSQRSNDNKNVLGHLFLWSPNIDTLMSAISILAITFLAYMGVNVFGGTWLNPIFFGLLGTVGVCTVLPLYWIVIYKKKNLSALGLTKKKSIPSLISSFLLGAFFFYDYVNSFLIDESIIPAVILGLYSLWEVICVYGWLQIRFEEAFGIIPAIILAGFSFCLYHVGYGWFDASNLMSLLIIGIMMAIIFRTTKNILILWPFFWPVCVLRGFKMGGFSPGFNEAISSAVLLILIIGAVIMVSLIQKKRLNS